MTVENGNEEFKLNRKLYTKETKFPKSCSVEGLKDNKIYDTVGFDNNIDQIVEIINVM